MSVESPNLLRGDLPTVFGGLGGLSSVALAAKVGEPRGLRSKGLCGYSAELIRATAAWLRPGASRPSPLSPRRGVASVTCGPRGWVRPARWDVSRRPQRCSRSWLSVSAVAELGASDRPTPATLPPPPTPPSHHLPFFLPPPFAHTAVVRKTGGGR